MEPEIREVHTDADIPAVREVARKTWADAYRDIFSEEVQTAFLRAAYSTDSLKRRMEADVFLVATGDGAVVGFADFLEEVPAW